MFVEDAAVEHLAISRGSKPTEFLAHVGASLAESMASFVCESPGILESSRCGRIEVGGRSSACIRIYVDE